jgi:cytochrome c-type biogenesis protein CcmH
VKWLSLLAALLLWAAPAAAISNPNERLGDPALEERAVALGREIRCLVCQNETIEASNADLAKDLRRLVRERIAAGDSDAQVLAFLEARYGDFVLMNPPKRGANLVLWLAPLGVLVLGGALIVASFRRRTSAEPAPLSAEERAALARLTGEKP